MSVSVGESTTDSLDWSILDVWALNGELSSTTAVSTAHLASLVVVCELEFGSAGGSSGSLKLASQRLGSERCGQSKRCITVDSVGHVFVVVRDSY